MGRLLDDGKKVMIVRRQKSLRNNVGLRKNMTKKANEKNRNINEITDNPFKGRQLTFAQRYRSFLSSQKLLKAQELLKKIPLERTFKESDADTRKSKAIPFGQNFTIQRPLKKPLMLKPRLQSL